MIKSIGRHRIADEDIMSLDVNKLTDDKKVDFMYTDPPWGEGNLKYWRTINNRDTGMTVNEVSLDDFMNRLFNIASNFVTNLIFIEYGLRWRDYIFRLAKNYKLYIIAEIPVRYRSGKYIHSHTLYILDDIGYKLPESYKKTVTNTMGYDTLMTALKPWSFPGLKIMDLCCGKGLTAKLACDEGMIFYGNEFNKKRVESTIKILEQSENIHRQKCI